MSARCSIISVHSRHAVACAWSCSFVANRRYGAERAFRRISPCWGGGFDARTHARGSRLRTAATFKQTNHLFSAATLAQGSQYLARSTEYSNGKSLDG